MESLEDKIKRVLAEKIKVEPYDPSWPTRFRTEANHLRACLPGDIIGRIEHFGSTAVPNMAAKPIVDMLVEVTDLQKTRRHIAPILESQGYDYFWRPTWGNDIPPFYAWFIKRNHHGQRTHHIHMIEAHFEHWDRLMFRDYLIEHPETTAEYQALKLHLAKLHSQDRVTYTEGKTQFIQRVTEMAKRTYIPKA